MLCTPPTSVKQWHRPNQFHIHVQACDMDSFPSASFIVPRSELNLGNGRWCRNWHGAYMSWLVVKKEKFFWDAYWRLQNGLIPIMNGRFQVLIKRERLIMNGEPACRSMIWAPTAVGGREIMGLARLLRH